MTRPATGVSVTCVASSDMMAPCENPISVVRCGVDPARACQVATFCKKAGNAAATLPGQLASVTPCTENH